MFLVDRKAFSTPRIHISAEQCFLHAQCFRVDCPCARFARITKPHDVFNATILGTSH